VVERAIHARHLRRLWGLPGSLLGVVSWPPSTSRTLFTHWDYWWQAHLLDCLVDAHGRAPTPARRSAIIRITRGIRWRNTIGSGNWTNDYYDDMAWLGLALVRAQRDAGVARPDAVRTLAGELRDAWTDHGGGGIWWRRRDDFKNVPANGPAAILLARLADQASGSDRAGCGDRADLQRARSTVDWIEEHLVDPETGLVWDGLHVAADGSVRSVEKAVYTYCQGVFLGACVELARRDRPADAPVWAWRAARTIEAVAEHLTVPGEDGPVLRGQGGGDGGLFAGILARYLAQAAIVLPTVAPEFAEVGKLAGALVFSAGEAAWRNRAIAPGGPLFGPEWSKVAVLPGRVTRPERDLSVQAGAWMLLEAAALLELQQPAKSAISSPVTGSGSTGPPEVA
jgi:predicted alpha-1,6-mannanase (GH76 family)